MHAQWFIVGIAPNYKLVLLQFRPLFIFISMRTTVRQGFLHSAYRYAALACSPLRALWIASCIVVLLLLLLCVGAH